MVNLSKENRLQKQYAIEVDAYQIIDTTNKWLGNGFTFVAQFPKYPHRDNNNEHVLIFQKPDDNKTGA